MKKRGKIIPLHPDVVSGDKSFEELEDKYFEKQGFDFEGWETEYYLTEEEDWEGLISYYKALVDKGQTEHCLQVANVYTEHLKQYQKAIDYLMPFYKKEPEREEIKQEIELAQNFIDKKPLKLTKKDLKKSSNSDYLLLFEFDTKIVSEGKTYTQKLNNLFKKYEYVEVDTDNNVYAVTKEGKKDFVVNNYDSYSTAHYLLNY